MTTVVFLHIPKTAGQSVHAALVNGFGEENVCPARVNDQLSGMTISDLNRYQVFSGHLDWSLLDCIEGPKYVFTILREPLDRVLSFYYFMRNEAAQLSPQELQNPGRMGMKAALNLTAHEYFTGGPQHLRNFLDDHYDNFYTYYFAGRHYRARSTLQGPLKRGQISRERLLEMAVDNMSHLDAVFSVDDMPAALETLRRLAPRPIADADRYRTNVNRKVLPEERLGKLAELGGNDQTLARLREFCALDDVLWQRFAGG